MYPSHYPACGHDWGYDNLKGAWRKVALWSRQPWIDVSTHDHAALPSGRIVSGISDGIRYVGVCIPWRDAHVSTGRKDRAPWQDQRAFLTFLRDLVPTLLALSEPSVLLGDFNQAIPRAPQPLEVLRELEVILDLGLTVPTAGLPRSDKGSLIDHITLSPSLLTSHVKVLPKTPETGFRVSDHDGIALTLHRDNRIQPGGSSMVTAEEGEPIQSRATF